MASHKRWHKPKPNVTSTDQSLSAIQPFKASYETVPTLKFHEKKKQFQQKLAEDNRVKRVDSFESSSGSSSSNVEWPSSVTYPDSWTKLFYQHYADSFPLANGPNQNDLLTYSIQSPSSNSNWLSQLYSNYLSAANGLFTNFSVGLPYPGTGLNAQYDFSSPHFNSHM